MKKFLFPLVFGILISTELAFACTGITLKTQNNAVVTARTVEWAAEPLDCYYVVVPEGYRQQSYLPTGKQEGLAFRAKYGFVGLAVEQPEFIMDGINEVGLAAGLFYFPKYGEYETYNEQFQYKSLSDFQVVAWILSNFSSIDAVKDAIKLIHVVSIDPRSSTVHWRITEPNGRQVVLEFKDGEPIFYENPLGVLTNSPELPWHLKNLNNYINLMPGSMGDREWGDITLRPFGGGSGMLGLPGDMTPPSRFVRAAFLQQTAPILANTEKTVILAFHLLNNFDIPIGMQMQEGQRVPNQPSATQWTIASDLQNKRLYYKTMYNATIRCIDLQRIDFKKVSYQVAPLDAVKKEPIVMIELGEAL